jgi:glycosyltransferase involved in cell wall biosynthesis
MSRGGTAEQPTVSVVIPCFNQAHFLAEAIESVLAQDHPVLETVVVDDGSADNACEVAARYPEVNPLRQPNRGVAAARNHGLAVSRGELVVFLDADDRLLPAAVAIGLDALAERPGVALAAGMSRDIGEDGAVLRRTRQPLVTQDHYLHLLEDCFIWSGSSVVYRRGAVEEVGGFDESLGAGDDYRLYLEIARRRPIFCHGEVVTEYRRHGANATRDPGLVLDSEMRVLRGQRRNLRDRRDRLAWRRGMRNVRARHGRAVAERAAGEWLSGRRREALRRLRTLARRQPAELGRFARQVLATRRIGGAPLSPTGGAA